MKTWLIVVLVAYVGADIHPLVGMVGFVAVAAIALWSWIALFRRRRA